MLQPKPHRSIERLFILFVFFAISQSATAQVVTGTVTDTSGKPIAFAAIKLADSKQGVIADLNGHFKFFYNKTFNYITVTHVSYVSKRVEIKDSSIGLQIQLEPLPNTLGAVIIPSKSYKLRRILNTALANRSINNPEKYDWYQCNVYYKTIMDVIPPKISQDSLWKKDSARLARKKNTIVRDSTSSDTTQIHHPDSAVKRFLDNQHLFMTETSSRRTWQKPQKLQEEVLASRMSGFKKSLFTALVTNVLPFHAYDDYINLNGKDFRNPLSEGMFNHFNFKIEEEILQGKDTLWVISFKPKKDIEKLSGSLYIHSYRFAIAHIVAVQRDTTLNREMSIEQQYKLENGKWFPQQLNYNLHWNNVMNSGVTMIMNGRSLVDSVNFTKNDRFKFDKAHTIKLKPGADELPDTVWQNIRPVPLDKKEQRTYVFMDSLGKKHNFDKIGKYMDKLIDGLYPKKYFDIDLKRLYSYNVYEQSRIGIGLQTNEKLSRKFVLGGWIGYGTGDKAWKYGGYSEVYLNPERDFTIRASYDKDLKDPGRLQIHKDLDKNFIRAFLLSRADEVKSYAVTLKKRMGYWENSITYRDENIQPRYDYAFDSKGTMLTNFNTREVSLGFRYAFAERMAPMFGRYYSLGSKYPIFYGRLTAGTITNNKSTYLQAVIAVNWKKHINRIGNEKFLVYAGKNFSKNPLPLSKLFAGNGFMAEDRTIYTFGGMQTMLPYQFYSNEFVNLYWNHEFDFKLFNKKIYKGLSTSPTIGLGYNMLVGGLKDTAVHKLVNFSVPNKPYHEAGFLLNRLLKMKFMGMYYVSFNAGYFYHFDGPFDHSKNGKFVFGLGADL